MRSHRTFYALLLTPVIAAVVIGGAGATADRQDVAAIVARVGERVSAHSQRVQHLICLERSTVIPVGGDWSSQAFARTVESELRVEIDAAGENGVPDVRVTREIRRINGREPRERDKTSRAGCTDPTPMSPEPLSFLLPARRDEFHFTAVRDAHERGRAALTIDFSSALGRSRPELIEDEYGHDDCFDWKGPVAIRGRVWVDAATFDVLRLERHIAGPTDVRVPLRLQRKYNFPPWLTIDRDDQTLRYKEVSFTDPDEVMLLPESIESVTVLRTSLQSARRTQTFSGYRRFLTETRIRK